ncbi:MAG: hypothetical protein WC630_01370 [Candidatus Babeliales bacterium]
MKYTLRIPLFVGVLFFNMCFACYSPNEIIEFTQNEVFIPARLGAIKLYKDVNGFHVINNNKICDVQNCFCDPLLRKMSFEQLKKFLCRDKPKMLTLSPDECAHINIDNMIEVTGAEKEQILNQLFSRGYISVNQTDDGEYILRIEHRLLGGGFWKILTWAGIGAIGCASAAAGGAEMLEASGHQVSLGPVLIVHSVIGAIGGGIIAILAGSNSSGQQQEDHSTTYGTDTVSVNAESVTARLVPDESARWAP